MSKTKPCACPFWDHEALAERLHKIGWTAPNDAQWDHLKDLCDEAVVDCRFSRKAPASDHPDTSKMVSDRERRLEQTLRDIRTVARTPEEAETPGKAFGLIERLVDEALGETSTPSCPLNNPKCRGANCFNFDKCEAKGAKPCP